MDQQDENDTGDQLTSRQQSPSAKSVTSPPPHVCEVRVTFPTNRQAQYALQVLQVDKEPTDRVQKYMEVVYETTNDKKDDDRDYDGVNIQTVGNRDGEADNNSIAVLKVRFESLELKMLRVSVSSFYDYLALVIKTFQEFDR